MSAYDHFIRPDTTHVFKEGADGFACAECGQGRGLHLRDGFVPVARDAPIPKDHHELYRSCYRANPYWDRPGTLRIKPDEREQRRLNRRAELTAHTRALKLSRKNTATVAVPKRRTEGQGHSPQGKKIRLDTPHCDTTSQSAPDSLRLRDSRCHGLPLNTPDAGVHSTGFQSTD